MRYAMRIAESASHQIFERKWWRLKPSCLYQCGKESCILMRLKVIYDFLSLNMIGWLEKFTAKKNEVVTVMWTIRFLLAKKGAIFPNYTSKIITNSSHYTWYKQDYPLNLSISVSGGKEINEDSLSNCEWTGWSSKCKSAWVNHKEL